MLKNDEEWWIMMKVIFVIFEIGIVINWNFCEIWRFVWDFFHHFYMDLYILTYNSVENQNWGFLVNCTEKVLKSSERFLKSFQIFENNDEILYEIKNIGLYIENCWKVMKNDEGEFCNFELYEVSCY